MVDYLLTEHKIMTYPAPDSVWSDEGRVMNKI